MKGVSLTEEGIKFFEVDRSRWDDLEHLFESKGGPSYCWCMVWRPMPKGSSRSDRHAKKESLRQQVLQGTPVGILGYVEGEPIAWCSIAPRDSYRKLGGHDDQLRDVWSIVCFFVHRRFRAKGMTRATDHRRGRPRQEKGRQGCRGLSCRSRRAQLPLHGLRGNIRVDGISGSREGRNQKTCCATLSVE